MSLRYASMDANGAIRGDTQLDDRTCECCTTGMALVAGEPVIAWRDRSAGEVRDISIVRHTSAGWSKPRNLHADGWKIAGCPVNGPQLDARGRRVVAAWFTAASGRGRTYVAYSDDGGDTFGKPIPVDDGNPDGRVDVAMIDETTAIVTWLEKTRAGAEVRARRVPRTGKPGPSFKIGDTSGRSVARIAVIGTDVYAAWTEQSATGKRIRVARLRP